MQNDFCNTIAPKATVPATSWFSRDVPKINKMDRSKGDLFDHLVGAQENGSRQINAKRLGSLEIDDRLEFSDLFDRDVAGFRAL